MLFTPWSVKRSWFWVEIGAAWMKGNPTVAVLYGLRPADLEENGQGKAFLGNTNLLEINDFEVYTGQLKARIDGGLP